MVAGAGRDAWRARLGVGRLELTTDGGLIDADEDARRLLPAARPGGDRACLSHLARRVPRDGTPIDLTMSVTRDGTPARLRVVAARIDPGGEPRIEALLLDLGAEPAHPERHFRHIYEHAPVAMHSIDERGRFCDVNRAWLALTGYERDEVVGREVTFLMTEESARRAVEEEIPRFWREGSVRGVPYRWVRADGSTIDVELDGDATVDPSGRRVSLAVVRDVTERHRVLGALAQRERELRRVLERSPDAILLHRGGEVVWANDRAADLLEAETPNDLVGQRLPGPLVEPGRPAAEAELHEVRLERPGGERVLEVARLGVHFEGRDTSLVMARDLTERRTLQARLAQADRLATVGTLAASVAHEVNNPLTYVIHYVDRLRRSLSALAASAGGLEGGEGIANELRALEEGAVAASEGCGRVREIVRDLKAFSRVEEESAVPIDLNRALRSAVQMASHQVRGRARLEADLGPLPAVRAHDGRLCQVFSNLLLNAAQAIEPSGDGAEDRIRVVTWSDGEWVFASVSDTGPGIAEEHRPRLFEPFFSTKPSGVGSGLGLWISRELVRELGGYIAVESEPGRGSTFTVVLPADGARARPESSAPPPPGSLAPSLLPSRRVLVVDDEPALRDLLAEALAERAHVVTASSGIAARELLENDDGFDAILCDLVMPGMNGVELYEWVRSSVPLLAGRIIFMTGAAYTPEMRELLGRVDNDRLDKPFRVRDVERALDRLLGPTVRIHA